MVRRRRRRLEQLPGVVGPARLDRRTNNLLRRLQPGDVAVIDHVDLDRATADALVASGVAAVVNAAPSTSGRYPNLGPDVLLAAGIPLLDSVTDVVFGQLRDGELVRLHDDALHVGERLVLRGALQDEASVGAAMAEARAGLVLQLEAFAADTMEYLLQERDLLLDGAGFPELATSLEGRHAVVVVRGYDYREDLRALRPYLRDYRPVLIGVDGGADVLLEAGYLPDLVVADPELVSDAALCSGAEVVVHARADGHAPGLARVQDLGVPAVVFPAAGTSEDIAMLLADQAGAQLIVAVGTHATLVEFLDKGRPGLASTFLTRLRVGSKLVDAKGASRLHRHRISGWALLSLVLATLVAMAVAVHASSLGEAYGDELAGAWDALWTWLAALL